MRTHDQFLLLNKEKIKRLFFEQDYSMRDIARLYGFKHHVIALFFREHIPEYKSMLIQKNGKWYVDRSQVLLRRWRKRGHIGEKSKNLQFPYNRKRWEKNETDK